LSDKLKGDQTLSFEKLLHLSFVNESKKDAPMEEGKDGEANYDSA